jgi:hypothetical protein
MMRVLETNVVYFTDGRGRNMACIEAEARLGSYCYTDKCVVRAKYADDAVNHITNNSGKRTRAELSKAMWEASALYV